MHLKKKHQILFKSRVCKDYYKVENLFKFLLAEKNSFIFESVWDSAAGDASSKIFAVSLQIWMDFPPDLDFPDLEVGPYRQIWWAFSQNSARLDSIPRSKKAFFAKSASDASHYTEQSTVFFSSCQITAIVKLSSATIASQIAAQSP